MIESLVASPGEIEQSTILGIREFEMTKKSSLDLLRLIVPKGEYEKALLPGYRVLNGSLKLKSKQGPSKNSPFFALGKADMLKTSMFCSTAVLSHTVFQSPPRTISWFGLRMKSSLRKL